LWKFSLMELGTVALGTVLERAAIRHVLARPDRALNFVSDVKSITQTDQPTSQLIVIPSTIQAKVKGTMRFAGGQWCRQSLSTISHHPRRPIATREFNTSNLKHQSNVNPDRHDGTSQHPYAASDDAYLNVQIDSENKTIKTAVGDLPLSPLMDPAFHEARQRWRGPKPTSTGHKPTKFQAQLARNPYGSAPCPFISLEQALTRVQPTLWPRPSGGARLPT